jgi:anti-anti-sigma regulatory factor
VNEAEQPEVHVTSVPGQRSGVQILKVSGPLTIRNFFEFQQMAREKTAHTVLVDFSDVPYIDSAALGSLVWNTRLLRKGWQEVRNSGDQ